jgi:hypothetical protein
MTIKIEKTSDGGRTVFRVSGRIGAENLEGLKTEIDGKKAGTALDLEHVTLVDVEGVRFLSSCHAAGLELLHCSPYIREWMAREQESSEE